MTWIAVVHDLVDKLRELSHHGDVAATQKVEAHDRFHRAGDLAASLKFERDLLKTVKDDFQLISQVEFADLERIQQDRHRCAHPSLSVDGDPFAPTAELARAHIRAAVEYVLRREPAQGRYALDMVVKQVTGDYFPIKAEQVDSVLSQGPLLKGRETLVRSFMVVCLKALLREKPSDNLQSKYRQCLRFLRKRRPEVFEPHLPTELARIARPLDLKDHGIAMLGLCRVRGVWEAYPVDIQTTLQRYVEHIPTESLDQLEMLYDSGVLKASCDKRISNMTPKEANETVWFEVPEAVWNRAVDGYCNANSFADANAWALEIYSYHKDGDKFRMTADQAEAICKAVIENRQVRDATKLPSVLSCVVAAGHTSGLWQEVIRSADVDMEKVNAWAALRKE